MAHLWPLSMAAWQCQLACWRLVWVAARRVNSTDFDEETHENDETNTHQ